MTVDEAMGRRLENRRSAAELGGRVFLEHPINQRLKPGTALAFQYYEFGNS
jgi:hypothetical protein